MKRQVKKASGKARIGFAPMKKWSLLAYIAGDNNLSDFGLADIEELCAVGTSPRVHAGVQIDTYGEHDGSIRYEISEPDWTGQAHRIVIQRLAEHDSGDPVVLANFVQWGLARYRSAHRLVVVWNHGSGFRGVRRDIAYDDFGSSLDMPELERGLLKGGLGPRKRASVLGFDACLMNMLEVVHQFVDCAEFVVGSQQLEPGEGWPYDQVLGVMRSQAVTPAALAAAIVKLYIANYQSQNQGDVTQSAINVKKTTAAVKALHVLGDWMADNMDTVRPSVDAARTAVQAYDYADYVDLIDLCDRLTFTHAVGTSRKNKLRMLTEAAIVKSLYFGVGVSGSNGLSVWFPADRRVYLSYRSKYLALRANQTNRGWVRFLDTYLSA